MSPKWTRTKLVIEISLSYRPIDAYCLYRGDIGSSTHILRFSLQSALFLSCMAMRILFSTFWFAILVFSVLKCEAVNFYKYSSAGMHGMSISNFWHTTFIYGQPACLHVHAMQCVHDVTAHAVTCGMM